LISLGILPFTPPFLVLLSVLLYVTLQVKIEELVTEMGGALHKPMSDLNFVIVKNVLAQKYKVWYMKFLFYTFILFSTMHTLFIVPG